VFRGGEGCRIDGPPGRSEEIPENLSKHYTVWQPPRSRDNCNRTVRLIGDIATLPLLGDRNDERCRASGAIADGESALGPQLDRGLGPRTALLFLGLLAAGVFFVAYSLYTDVDESGARTTTFLPYLLLFVALLIALGFEFVNGFHDTANAVATVIYTRSLPAEVAVVWSGAFNFLGILLSSGAVAFGIISLLPVELILQVGSSAGFAMVFALLIAAIIWNLGTWSLGVSASRSHTLIGSIIGVGIATALARGHDGTSGVDWGQGTNVGKALLFSPSALCSRRFCCSS
jgi:inorganic phosphate transporter, PiT family